MTSSFANAWAGIGGVSVFLLATLAIAHRFRRNGMATPEGTRKLMHVALGASTLSFPLLFRAVWPPIVVACLTATVLVLLRSGTLGTAASSVVHGVSRRSEGDLYFPFAAALLFAITDRGTATYAIPLATLTLADPLAALAGRRFGRTLYASGDGVTGKSVEGSLTFFVVSLCTALIALELGTDVTAPTALLTALTFALVTTLLEAVAWRGLDNLFIPVGGSLLLAWLPGLDTRALVTLLLVIVAMIAIVLPPPRRRPASPQAIARLRSRHAWT